MISPSSPDYPGDWAQCQAGEPAPLGAIQAPDKFTSFVCMWPEKDFVLGRGLANHMHVKGMDAWFPHGGEWSAAKYHCRFLVLVDDGKIPGLYSWAKISKLGEMPELKPVVVAGLSPVVVDNILGKGSVDYLTAWTSEGGKEFSHDKETVLGSLVLCRRQSRTKTVHGWREIHVHEPAKITEKQIINECIEKQTKTLINDDHEKVKPLRFDLKYKSLEGQEWKVDEEEECDLETVIKSENVIRRLAEADFTLGRVLYGTSAQSIQITDAQLSRSYDVQPRTEMAVTTSVHRQTYQLSCPAMEYIFTKEGKLVLKRLVKGRWKCVTTNEVKSEISERKMREAAKM